MVKLNIFLGVYQLLGFVASFISIKVYANQEGRMAVFFVLLAAALHTPFIIVSSFGLLNRENQHNKIKLATYFGTALIVILPTLLILFFDKEFIYISIVGLVLFLILYFLRRDYEKQLLVLNVTGSLFLSGILLLWLLGKAMTYL